MIIPDQEFSNPRLASLYDQLDGNRDDLEAYIAMVDEFGAQSVLDFGCGTGSLLLKLLGRNLKLTGVDPAKASLDIAKKKKDAGDIRWIQGGAEELVNVKADFALMTGNVAQVFLTDEDWLFTLKNINRCLSTSGIVVFETRIPGASAWTEWTREKSEKTTNIYGVGKVTSWLEVTEVSIPFVSFKWHYAFHKDDTVLISESTLRFREKEEIEKTLALSGFELLEVRQAPDRPGKEFVLYVLEIQFLSGFG